MEVGLGGEVKRFRYATREQTVTHSKDGFIAFDNETVVCELLPRSGQPEVENQGLKITESFISREGNLRKQ